MKSARATILQKLVHVLTALTITLKAVAKMEHAEGSQGVILFFLASAVYIIAITLLHAKLHKHERRLTASVYAIECVVTAIVTWLYATEGKQGLQFVTGIASVGFAIAFMVHLTKARK
ncbi:MAG TPA: hypothetical protein VGQ76_05070 [Thermoanaerobaculia bacterium]|jgi:hypothetical protein|nr:hypothetical protein [Thermoanaerobaculia bacterium]